MATIYREISIEADPDVVWAAVRDVDAVHQRLAPGLVTDTRLEDGVRVVTFANGFVVRERIVAVDDRTRRLAYAAVGGGATHHNASMQVFDDGRGASRLVWITDILPDEMAGPVGGIVEQAAPVIKETLEAAARTEDAA